MFKINRNKKTSAVIAGGVLAVATAGGAYAYWTTQGDGTGSAATSAGAASLVVSQVAAPQNLFPGGPAGDISGTVKNTADNSAYVTSVAVTVTGTNKEGCDATDYVVTNSPMAVNTDVAAGGTVAFNGAKLAFVNKTANQDACKGATVNLAYAAR